MDEAGRLLMRAVEIRRARLRPDNPARAAVLGSLGGYYAQRAEYERARDAYREALAVFPTPQARRHPAAITILSDFASLLGTLNQYAQAEGMQREAIDVGRQVLGPDTLTVANLLNNLGVTLSNLGRHDEAQAHLSRRVRHPPFAARRAPLAHRQRGAKHRARARPAAAVCRRADLDGSCDGRPRHARSRERPWTGSRRVPHASAACARALSIEPAATGTGSGVGRGRGPRTAAAPGRGWAPGLVTAAARPHARRSRPSGRRRASRSPPHCVHSRTWVPPTRSMRKPRASSRGRACFSIPARRNGGACGNACRRIDPGAWPNDRWSPAWNGCSPPIDPDVSPISGFPRPAMSGFGAACRDQGIGGSMNTSSTNVKRLVAQIAKDL